MTFCAGHADAMKKSVDNNLSITHQKPSEPFQKGNGQPFATVDVKNLIFWAACSVPGLVHCKHKPFISTVLVDANQLLTYAGHSHGSLE